MEELLKYICRYNTNSLLMIQVVLIISLPFLIWRMKFVKKWIPLVAVQIITGILLGESVLGKINPDIYEIMWPEKSMAILNGVGLIGVIFFVFIIGTEFEMPDLKGKKRSMAITAGASIIIPFITCFFGASYLLTIFPQIIGIKADKNLFVTGIALIGSVTALPVLSSIIDEVKYTEKHVGKIAIAIAMTNDVFVWICLSVIIAFSKGTGNLFYSLKTLFFIFLFIFVMVFMVKKMLLKIMKNRTTLHNSGIMTIVVSFVFLSALVTEIIGVHYVLGAFVAGSVIPKEIAETIKEKLDDFLKTVILPFFFVSLGLSLNFSLSEKTLVLVFIVLSVCSIGGKIAGSAWASRLFGLTENSYDALIFGNFMSCKGMIGVVVSKILFEAEIIGYQVFSALILMSILSIVITKPIHIFIEKVEVGFIKKDIKHICGKK